MAHLTRRSATLGLMAMGATSACTFSGGQTQAARIDARVDATLDFMYENHPEMRQIASQAKAMLVMPVVTEGGIGLGFGYGQGALRIGDLTVDYFSITSASTGLQIGVSQYAHVLFFLNDDALKQFRTAAGWTVGADFDVVAIDDGETLRVDSTIARAPVVSFVFGQAGFRVGLTLEGAKYTRIIP